MTKTYADQHRGLVDIGSAILAAAALNTPASLTKLAQLRLDLAKALQDHVSAELDMVTGGPGQAEGGGAILRRYHDELLAWRKQLIECNAAWPLKAIAGKPMGFISAFLPVHRALEARVRWEEEVFYPAMLSRDHLARRAAA